MPDHSPLPWSFIPAEKGWTAGIDAANGDAVVWQTELDEEGITNPANASLIVRAVNSHAALVEALREFAILGYGKCTIGKPAAEKARAALMAAEEVS